MNRDASSRPGGPHGVIACSCEQMAKYNVITKKPTFSMEHDLALSLSLTWTMAAACGREGDGFGPGTSVVLSIGQDASSSRTRAHLAR